MGIYLNLSFKLNFSISGPHLLNTKETIQKFSEFSLIITEWLVASHWILHSFQIPNDYKPFCGPQKQLKASEGWLLRKGLGCRKASYLRNQRKRLNNSLCFYTSTIQTAYIKWECTNVT